MALPIVIVGGAISRALAAYYERYNPCEYSHHHTSPMNRIASLFFLVLFSANISAALFSVNIAAARQYGSALAIDGNVLIAGDGNQPAVPGAIYFYEQDAEGRWFEASRMEASDADGAVDSFGKTIAVHDSTMIVGAPESGKAYVFSRNSNGDWIEDAILSGGQNGFGNTVAIHGSTAMIAGPTLAGEPRDKDADGEAKESNEGETVSIYERAPDGSWRLAGNITPEDAASGNGFGTVITLSTERVVISAPASSDGAGVVYVYGRSSVKGRWDLETEINAPVPHDGNQFGAALWMEEDILAIGSPGYSIGAGAVFLYRFDESTSNWNLHSQLSAFSAKKNTGFGSSIAVDSNQMWVGAPGYGGRSGTGAVFEYEIDMTSLAVTGSRLTATRELHDKSQYGASLAVGSQVLAIGSPGYDHRAGVVFAVAKTGGDWSISKPLENDIFAYESMGGSLVECEQDAAGDFPCKDVDMMSFISVKDMGADRGIRTNDLWGWEDPETGREYAIVGLYNQTSFVDVTDPYHPVYLGELDMTDGANAAPWRDMKVYRDHAYIVSDGAGAHGIQIFDLRQLRDVQNPPVVFEETGHYSGIFSAHNIVINEDTGFAYVVGSSAGGETCGGGLHMIDLSEPANPSFAGCFSDGVSGRRGTGYSHDAQCVIYHGPDVDYQGHEICIGSNETAISISDVTDKANPIGIAMASYPSVAYAHQGWLTDDHRYFYLNDELDESQGLVENTRTLIWNLEDLDEPELAGEFLAETTEGDHNLYVKGDFVYQSITSAGLRILDISNPEEPFETAYFDTSPVGGRGVSWSNYPFFKSGIIVVTAGHYGLFILRKKGVDI